MRGSYALYQGTTLVGPLTAERELGFSPCGSTASAVTVTSGLADPTGGRSDDKQQSTTLVTKEIF
jgi:hypothetical protein